MAAIVGGDSGAVTRSIPKLDREEVRSRVSAIADGSILTADAIDGDRGWTSGAIRVHVAAEQESREGALPGRARTGREYCLTARGEANQPWSPSAAGGSTLVSICDLSSPACHGKVRHVCMCGGWAGMCCMQQVDGCNAQVPLAGRVGSVMDRRP